MADANRAAPIGTRSVERFLRRFYNLAGMTVTDHVRGDLSPSVEMRPVQPHELLDFGVVPVAGRFFAPAVAAQFSFVDIRPLSNPSMHLVITHVFVNGVTAFAGLLAPSAAIAGNTVQVIDTGFLELGQALSSAAHVAISSNAATPAGVQNQYVTGAATAEITAGPDFMPVAILRLGSTSSFQVWGTAVNTGMNVGVTGYAVPSNMSTV